jgi:hypothetical protein
MSYVVKSESVLIGDLDKDFAKWDNDKMYARIIAILDHHDAGKEQLYLFAVYSSPRYNAGFMIFL